jgi:DNA ligase-1
MVTTFPTLYKKTSSGAIQQWRTWVTTQEPEGFGVIHTEHGQVGGKLQSGADVVKEGKNIGKKNATLPDSQAALEAEAKWRKKQEREGYVKELERAQAGEDDAEGGIKPMLAKSREDVNGFPFPADYQRKFNGVRCEAVISDGEVSLWSRRRKRILGVPHIQAAYERAFAGVKGDFIFDGELYRHGWSLQKISGYVRKEKTKPGFEQLGHHIYDMPSIDEAWYTRRDRLSETMAQFLTSERDIHKVDTVTVSSMAEADLVHDEWVQEGYEGGILRAWAGKYKFGSRSSDLLKVKRFQDREFPIVAVNEGRGKFAGKAVFTCKTDEGMEFDVCAPGNFEDRAEFLRRGAELIGKHLTVKFFEWTEDRKPCFPVGMAVRDDYE